MCIGLKITLSDFVGNEISVYSDEMHQISDCKYKQIQNLSQ